MRETIYTVWCVACLTVIAGVILYGIVTGEGPAELAAILRGLDQ